MTKFYDTSALLDAFPDLINNPIPFLLSLTTLQELEKIKTTGKDEDIKYRARKLLLFLHANPAAYSVIYSNKADNFLMENGWPITNDNLIMAEAVIYQKENGTGIMFVTSDLSCYFLAINQFRLCSSLFIPNKGAKDYTGFIREKLSGEEMAQFYTETEEHTPKRHNSFSALTNQYVILENENGTVVDMYRWSGEEYLPLKYETIKTPYMGIVMPINLEQKLAFDLLQNEEIGIKILTGCYGSGKSFLTLANALYLLKAEKINKIIYMRNGVKVKDVKDIGALPGSSLEKLLPGAMPLADHLGGLDNLLRLVDEEKIELVDLGMVRGRSWENSLILCGEAENLTTKHVQLLIGRVGKGSQLWLDGDYRQVDGKAFEVNNGLMTAIHKLKGRSLFGFVKLMKTERSATSSLADLLD